MHLIRPIHLQGSPSHPRRGRTRGPNRVQHGRGRRRRTRPDRAARGPAPDDPGGRCATRGSASRGLDPHPLLALPPRPQSLGCQPSSSAASAAAALRFVDLTANINPLDPFTISTHLYLMRPVIRAPDPRPPTFHWRAGDTPAERMCGACSRSGGTSHRCLASPTPTRKSQRSSAGAPRFMPDWGQLVFDVRCGSSGTQRCSPNQRALVAFNCMYWHACVRVHARDAAKSQSLKRLSLARDALQVYDVKNTPMLLQVVRSGRTALGTQRTARRCTPPPNLGMPITLSIMHFCDCAWRCMQRSARCCPPPPNLGDFETAFAIVVCLQTWVTLETQHAARRLQTLVC